jgi:hypothetical protein
MAPLANRKDAIPTKAANTITQKITLSTRLLICSLLVDKVPAESKNRLYWLLSGDFAFLTQIVPDYVIPAPVQWHLWTVTVSSPQVFLASISESRK